MTKTAQTELPEMQDAAWAARMVKSGGSRGRCGDCGLTREDHAFGRDRYNGATVTCRAEIEAAMRSHDREVAANLRGGLSWTSVVSTVALAGALAWTPAYATPFTVDFGAGPLGNLGPVHDFTSAGVTIHAAAFGPGAPDLWTENLGPDERLIGATGSVYGDNELTSDGRFDQFSVSSAAGPVTSLLLAGNSTTPSDTGAIYGSNVSGVLGTTLLATFNTHAPIDLSSALGAFAFFDVVALPLAQQPVGSNDSVGVASISGTASAVPVPEPSALAMLGVALLGLGMCWRPRTR